MVQEKKQHEVTNSNGTKEAWRWFKKNKWLDSPEAVTEKQFGLIIKAINNTLQDQLFEGKDVLFPKRMGRVEIRKYLAKVECKDDKVITTLPIDWKRTKELWEEDEGAKEAKTLIRFEGLERFTFYYNKEYANYKNKRFYKFIPIRPLKKRLRDRIMNGGFDALLLAKNNELY